MALLGAVVCVGCGEKKPAEAPKAAETGADVDVMGSDIEKALANLSEADRALAVKQKVCPVTKEPLGSMGEPIKIEKDGQALFICCEGCKEKLEANFAEYAAEYLGEKSPAARAEDGKDAAAEPAAEEPAAAAPVEGAAEAAK